MVTLQEINEVSDWLVTVLGEGTNPAVWIGAQDTTADGNNILWTHDDSHVNASYFWTAGEPDYEKSCVCMLPGQPESGLKMEYCHGMGYPLCKKLFPFL